LWIGGEADCVGVWKNPMYIYITNGDHFMGYRGGMCCKNVPGVAGLQQLYSFK